MIDLDDFLGNICELEIFLSSPIFREEVDKLEINTKYQFHKKGNFLDVKIGVIDFSKGLLLLDKFFVDLSKLDDDMIKDRYQTADPAIVRRAYNSEFISSLADALIRTGILRPNLIRLGQHLSRYDDVILGIDTNMFYNCMVTSCLLDSFVGVCSNDFLDTPNWITLVMSKVSMGEIEYVSNKGKVIVVEPLARQRRFACRALQEIMQINRCADLEGVSMFITGSIPPEFKFSSTGPVELRDSEIRDQIKSFLKKIDFHKGAFFATQDRTCAMLAEAEGMHSILIKKPSLKPEFQLSKGDIYNVSEILYELAVAFQPLEIKATKNNNVLLRLNIDIEWAGKDLKDWEDWRLEVKIIEDKMNLKERIFGWVREMKSPELAELLKGWQLLKKRYLSWDKQ